MYRYYLCIILFFIIFYYYLFIIFLFTSLQNTSAEEENYQGDLDDEGIGHGVIIITITFNYIFSYFFYLSQIIAA